MNKKNNTKTKHIPLRSCVICRVKLPKKELIRIVRTPAMEVVLDNGNDTNGRGAYLCQSRQCWDKSLVKNNIGHALKIAVSMEDKQTFQVSADARIN